MAVSRLFSQRILKFSSVSKYFLPSDSVQCIFQNFAFAKPNSVQFLRMSTSVETLLNDPKRHLDYQQLLEKQKQNVVLIDVRNYDEISETGKIPGSINVPLPELSKALGEMSDEDFSKKFGGKKPDKETEIIFSCRSGMRSLKALRIGLELGYLKAGNYKGGWLDWAENSCESE